MLSISMVKLVMTASPLAEFIGALDPPEDWSYQRGRAKYYVYPLPLYF